MNDHELDLLARKVLLESMEPEPEDTDGAVFAPSERYERSMRAMLRNPEGWADRRTRPVWKRSLQRAAVVLLVCAVSLGSVAAVSSPVRAELSRWWMEVHETDIVYRYSGEELDGEMPQYEITDLPEGYVEDLDQRLEWPNYIFFVYQNSDPRKEICFDYEYMQEGSLSQFVPTEDTSIRSVTVNGLEGQLFAEKDWENKRSIITWIDPDANLQFTVYAFLPEADMLRLAESVSLVKRMPQYQITDLPEGYAESVDERIEMPTYISIKYRNQYDESAEWICFSYGCMQEGSASIYVTENADVIPVTVNGMAGQLFLSRDLALTDHTVTWIDPDQNLQFDISASVDKDSLLRMAESVSLDPSAAFIELPRYGITDLPEGYAEKERVEDPGLHFITYENIERQKKISLDYAYTQYGLAIGDSIKENADVYPVTVNGMEGQLYLSRDPESLESVAAWADPEQRIDFTLSAFAGRDDLLRMAESVSLVKIDN